MTLEEINKAFKNEADRINKMIEDKQKYSHALTLILNHMIECDNKNRQIKSGPIKKIISEAVGFKV